MLARRAPGSSDGGSRGSYSGASSISRRSRCENDRRHSADLDKAPPAKFRGKIAAVRSIKGEIECRVRAALARIAGPAGEAADPLVRPTQDTAFGDYQS